MKALLWLWLPLFALPAAAQRVVYLYPDAPDYLERDVRTGTDGHVRVDNVRNPFLRVFPPVGDRPARGLVLICPGGGYRYLSVSKEGDDVARRVAAAGFVGIVLNYRLAHEAPWDRGLPVPQRDGLAALYRIRDLVAAGELPAAPLSIIGFSAGGHLAATLTQLAPPEVRPRALTLLYPVISFRPELVHAGSRDALLGAAAPPEIVARWSAENGITADHPPTFLVHARDDTVVPVGNAEVYHRELRRRGIAAELLLPEGGGHGFGLAGTPDWTVPWLRWLTR